MFIQSNSSEVYHPQILELLTQIKIFLLKNQQTKGSTELLAKIDKFIVGSSPKQADSDEKQKIQEMEEICKLKSIYADYSIKQQIMEPRQCANLIDAFVLEYNIIDNNYKIVTQNIVDSNNKVKQETQNDRKAILELVLGAIKEHVNEKQKTNSMTELHKLTSNVPKFVPALILPNYTGENAKYTYIYQTKQCIERRKNYYLVDRYYCFVTDGLATYAVDELCKKVKNRVYESRLSHPDPFNVNHKTIKQSLQKAFQNLAEFSNNKLVLSRYTRHEWVEKQVSLEIEELKMSLSCSLLTLITYLAICEFKIVLTVSKNEKYKLSDVALSMQASLGQLKYIYPVVFCSLTKEHCDFVESPVPLLIGFWGSQKRRAKFRNQLDRYLNQHQKQKGLPTIAIDIQNLRIKASVGITNEDVFIIQKIDRFIGLYGKGDHLWERMADFIKGVIQNKNNKEILQKNEWLALLQKKIVRSQMFQQFQT